MEYTENQLQEAYNRLGSQEKSINELEHIIEKYGVRAPRNTPEHTIQLMMADIIRNLSIK